MKKTCFKCHISKPLTEFYIHKGMTDGHLGKCKDCAKQDSRSRYANPDNREKIVQREKERYKNPHRKIKVLEYQRKSRTIDKQRWKAWRAAAKLKKKPCEKCGKLPAQAHHPDYYKPIDVVWLCHSHHVIEHGKIPSLRND